MALVDWLNAHTGELVQAAVALPVAFFSLLLWRIEHQRDHARLVIEGVEWEEDGAFVISISNLGGHDSGIRSVIAEVKDASGTVSRLFPVADPSGTYSYRFAEVIVRSGLLFDLRIAEGCWAPTDLPRDFSEIIITVVPVIGKNAEFKVTPG